MKKGFIIAIDGPAAAGKGTIAPILASRLKGYHLYTGSMYRSVTLYCIDNHIDIHDEVQVTAALHTITIDLKDNKVLLNDRDVSERIRQRDIDVAVAIVADYQSVRDAMIKQQQRIGQGKTQIGEIVIAEGRDTATKVFPGADIKIYLTAKPEIRAQRRLKQLEKQGLTNLSYEEILQETITRDEQDIHGNLGYLVGDPQNYGYEVIDDSNESEEQTVEKILGLLNERKLLND